MFLATLAGEGCRKVPTKEKGEWRCGLALVVISGMLAGEECRKVSTKEKGECGVGAASCLACWLGRSAERYQPKRKESVVWGWCS